MIWILASVGNLLVSLAYFGIAGAILVPLLRAGQVRANRLGTATAAIFFSCAVGHGMMGLHPLLFLLGDHSAFATASHVVEWHEAVWDLLTGGVGVYYWTLRRTYRELLRGAVLFDDLREQQRVRELETAAALAAADRRADEQHRVQERLHREVLDSLEEGVVTVARDGSVIVANPAARALLGPTVDDRTGSAFHRNRWDTVTIDGRAMSDGDRPSAVVLRTGQPVRDTVVGFTDPLGQRRWFSLNSYPLRRSGETEPYAAVTTMTDISARRAVEEERRLATVAAAEARDAALDATAAKSTFLATMSHEIRTPINAILAVTELLLETDLTDEQQEFAETAVASGGSLLAIINDILDFSKIEARALVLDEAAFDVRDCVDGAVDLLAAGAAGKGLDLVADVAVDVPDHLVGDAGRVRQVLINLIGNAVKFTDAGQVIVAVRTQEAANHSIILTSDVSDSGPGITAEGLERLFTSFGQADAATTGAYGGTGLGLVISRRLAQAMGGELTVRSTFGQGATFTFTAVLHEARRTADPDFGRPAFLAGRHVLSVDDNAVTQGALVQRLKRWGMDCTAVSTPEHACRLLASDAHYDVALIDAHLPSVDGVALVSAVRALPARLQLPLVIFAGIGTHLDPAVRALSAAVVRKPVRNAALRAVLTGIFRGPTPTSATPHPSVGAPGIGGNPSRLLRVLLAEDNPDNRKVMTMVLVRLGHHVESVTNGLQAVDAVRNHTYDVVLMDLQMPVLNGLDASRRIRTELPPVAQPWIVALTGNALLEDREACLEAGIDGYLPKPFRKEDLQAVLATAPGIDGGAGSRVLTEPATVLNPSVLEALTRDAGDTVEDIRGPLVDIYLREGSRQVTDLMAAATRGDVVTARRIAHQFRSASAVLGALELAALLLKIEAADLTTDLKPLAQLVTAEYRLVTTALTAYTAEPEGQQPHISAARSADGSTAPG